MDWTINSGNLRHWVTFLKPVEKTGPVGKEIVWTPVCTVRAKISTGKGTIANAAGQQVSVVSKIISIRYRADLTAEMRVRTRSEDLEISYIDNVEERNSRLDVYCSALGRKI